MHIHTKTQQIPGRKEPDNLSPFGWISGGLGDNSRPLHRLYCLSTSDRSGPHAHVRRRSPTSPLSQLSLDFSKQKPLLSENLKLGSDKAGELPETDPSVYLAAAWQSPIPTVEAVRASHAEQPALFPHLTLIMLRGSHTEWAHCSFSGT